MGYVEEFVNSKGETIKLSLRFHRESRIPYQIESVEQLFEDDYQLLKDLVDHHEKIQMPRIQELYDYAQGNNHEILQDEFRRNESDMSDHRATHNYGRRISTFRQGYLVGIPVQVEYIDGKEKSVTDIALQELNSLNDFDELNRKLVLDLSQVGRAYDIAYYTHDEELRFSRLDPRQTFVIYDNTIDKNLIAGVRYYKPTTILDSEETYVELYTKEARYYFIMEEDSLQENSKKAGGSIELNGFQEVQITEYLNNEQGIGDYETELPLIDLYDAAQSDTANYMTDLADAILMIYGNVDFPEEIDTPEKEIEYMKQMRRARLMQLIPPQDDTGKERTVSAEYLYKQYDVSGTEAYKTRLKEDINHLTSTPDLSDTSFGEARTGEAMKYKLFGLDQERVSTQAMFERGLRRRYQLLANIYPQISTTEDKHAGAFQDFEGSLLRITFTPNLPKASAEVVNMASSLWNIVSDETIFGILESVTDVSAANEKQRLKDEEQEAREQFGTPLPRLEPGEKRERLEEEEVPEENEPEAD